MVINRDVKLMKILYGIGRSQQQSKSQLPLLNFKFLNQPDKKITYVDDDDSSSLEYDSKAIIPYSGSNSLGSFSPRDPSSSSSKSLIRKMKLLSEIYERCSLAIIELKFFQKTSKHDEWMSTMQEKIKMIKKNDTWELVERLPH